MDSFCRWLFPLLGIGWQELYRTPSLDFYIDKDQRVVTVQCEIIHEVNIYTNVQRKRAVYQ